MSTPSKPDGVEYRPVAGFDSYCVGSDGSVWSRWKYVSNGPGRGNRREVGSVWKRLKPYRWSQMGHLCVTLCPGGVRRGVHVLVLEAFVGPCPPGMESRHFPDRDPANNRRENLSWATHAANLADRCGHGTMTRGERHGGAKLTDEIVRDIRRIWATSPHPSQAALSRRFGTSQQHVSDIVNRKRWLHLPVEAK